MDYHTASQTSFLSTNKDLFDKAKVAYPTDRWTWTDVLNAAIKIRALGPSIFGIYQPINVQ